MRRPSRYPILLCLLVAATRIASAADGRSATHLPNLQPFPDPSGAFATLSLSGAIDLTNPFFQDLGTNGRRCVTCHQPAEGWSITPPHLRARFAATEGNDPVFRPIDGAGCPDLDVSSVEARRKAYGLLLRKGLIRVALRVPAKAEFTVARVDNPYGCNRTDEISVYRRPLPTANLRFLSTVMWDGRESLADGDGRFRPIVDDLAHQAVSATFGHAEAERAPTPDQVRRIVAFERGLFLAQVTDLRAGPLDRRGAAGGPLRLSQQEFFLGINDPLGGNPKGTPFTPRVFDLFATADRAGPGLAAIARGERIFNTRKIRITGVAGLNDLTGQRTIAGFCGTCHDTPNVGNHSLPAPLDIGLVVADRRTPDLPLITLRNRTTGALVRTTDPGRALVTGRWADIGKFKGPILRGLAARAPYFHDGSAATLLDVVRFYDERFKLKLSGREKRDLAAFLAAL